MQNRDHHENDHMLPTNKYVTIQLPQLNTLNERKENLHYAAYFRTSIAENKQV